MNTTRSALSRVYQSHQGAVNTMSTPYVESAYAEDQTSNIYTNGLRQESMTYPSGRVVFHDYGTAEGISDRLGRILRQRETNSTGTILTEYSYNGTGRLVTSDYQQPDVKLDLYGGTTGTYAAFDRFSRTIDHRWIDYGGMSVVDVDRIKHGYDYAGNRLWREDPVAAAQMAAVHQDEFYAFDGLQRFKNAQRGNLTGSPYTGVTSRNLQQDWTLNQLGNWATFKEMDTDTGSNWDLDQDRSHNAVNEISGISTSDGTDWADPAHDAAGNMTTMPQPLSLGSSFTATYDAWNRLITISSGMTVVTTNEYDGLNRRVIRDETGGSGDKRHFYYNEAWQVLEERVEAGGTIDSQPINEHVWHPYYIDALAVRYYDSNTDGSGIVRYWYLQDANFNVTAVVEDDGDVVERYRYAPYGEPTVLDANFAADADGTSDIGNVYFYTGRERDPETGLQLNRNRYYHAGLGRWLTRDPIGYEGSKWNLYEYAACSPLQMLDPSGELIPKPPIIPDPEPIPTDTCRIEKSYRCKSSLCIFIACPIGYECVEVPPPRLRPNARYRAYCVKCGGACCDAQKQCVAGIFRTPIRTYAGCGCRSVISVRLAGSFRETQSTIAISPTSIFPKPLPQEMCGR